MNEPWFNMNTRTFEQLEISNLDPLGIYISATTSDIDLRSSLPIWDKHRELYPKCSVMVTSERLDDVTLNYDGANTTIELRDVDGIAEVLPTADSIFIDITGLSHHVWAALVRVAIEKYRKVTCIYAEPSNYKWHTNPVSQTLFDLTEEFGGLQPLPGFTRIGTPPKDKASLFVPFLGFEGMRALRLITALDPPPKVISPVIGVPGFQPEYPTYTVVCNMDFLEEHRAHANIRLARADCPFEAMFVLKYLCREYEDPYLFLAPVGTKPHALGVVLFALQYRNSEIMYDFPKRRKGRTSGVGKIHFYQIKE